MKRRYTMDQYRADVAKLGVAKTEPLVESESLEAALVEGAALEPAENMPRDTAIQSQPPPAKKGFMRHWSGLRRRIRSSEPAAAKTKRVG